jgi:YbbR domain-containing protein
VRYNVSEMETETSRGAAARQADTPQSDATETISNGPERSARRSNQRQATVNTEEVQNEQETVDITVETAAEELEPSFPRPNIGLETGTEREVDAEFVSVAGAPAVITSRADRVRQRAALPRIEVDDRVGRLLLSVVLAALMWFYVITLQNPTTNTRFGPLPVDVRNLGSSLKVLNELVTVDAHVQAPQNVLSTIERSDVVPYVDATGLESGVHELPVLAELNHDNARDVSVTFNPSSIQIQIQLQASEVFSVEVRQVGTPAFGYDVEEGQATPSEVTVSGPNDAVNSIDAVVVQIDVDGKGATQQGIRTPIALDADGQVIEGLTFEPATVQVVQPIELLVNYRVVPVRVPVEGQPAPGYWVSSIVIDPTKVTICCSPEAINQHSSVSTEPVNITGATDTVVTTTQLLLPPGITLFAEQSTAISVTVSVEPLETTWQQSVGVTLEGVEPGLSGVVSPNRVELLLSGTLADLQDLSPTDIRAFVNVQGRDAGIYTLRPEVVVPPQVRIESVTPVSVTVTLIAPTAVPTETPVPLPTATPTATGVPTTEPTPTATLPAATASPSPRPPLSPTPGPPDAQTPTPAP